jgi:predicted transcriptional regulator YheO
MTDDATRRGDSQHLVDSKPRRSIDGERLLAVFASLIEPIGRSLPASSEIVLHDLSLLPDSIVAIHGDVTGRRIGDPATDLLLQKISTMSDDSAVGYETTLADGRKIRSSTMIIRDVSGAPVAALCINSDLSAWISVQRIADLMLGLSGTGVERENVTPLHAPESPEVFVRDVDELASHLIHRAIAQAGVPVELMQKRHKVEVVRDLKSRGMFMLRDAVDLIATSLNVTRFTIYNYLNEIGDDAAADETGDPDATKENS